MKHRFPVLQHVGNAGRCASVVFQDEELVRPRAYNVDADNVRVDPAGRRNANHFGQERVVLSDELDRDPPRAYDLLAVINVEQECINCPNALFYAAR